MPVTTPVDDTEAMEGLLLLQLPPDMLSRRVSVDATHTDDAPLMVPAVAAPATVTVVNDQPVPQVPVTA
jgi:hypothetical protein